VFLFSPSISTPSAIKQVLMCPIQIHSLLVYFALLGDIVKQKKKKAMAVKHLLVSLKSKCIRNMYGYPDFSIGFI